MLVTKSGTIGKTKDNVASSTLFQTSCLSIALVGTGSQCLMGITLCHIRWLKLTILYALIEQLPSDPQICHPDINQKPRTDADDLMLNTNKKNAKPDS